MGPEDEIKQPASLDKKLEQQTHELYDNYLKAEAEKEKAAIESEAAKRFDDVRRLGFLTKDDVAAFQNQTTTQLNTEVENLKKEIVALREFIFRAKAQGLNSGALDQPKNDNSELDFINRYNRTQWK